MNPYRIPAEHEKLIGTLKPSLARLALQGVVRTYRKNTVVINESEPGESLFILLQGQVKVFATDANAREITYGTIEAGDYFGEMCLDGGPRSASVMTSVPSVCSVVPGATVRDYLVAAPAFAIEIVNQVIRRARAATDKARQMALLDVYGRVVHALENDRGPGSERSPVFLNQVTHQQIANRVGASREMVSRLLKDLEKGGYVELGVKRIVLRRKLPARW